MMDPVTLSGSAPATTKRSPVGARRCTLRSAAAASGNAYCSPESPTTKRPPSASPRASSRRRAHTTSPGDVERLATPHLPGHDAPTDQQLPRHRLGQLFVGGQRHVHCHFVGERLVGSGEERPTAFADAGAGRCPPTSQPGSGRASRTRPTVRRAVGPRARAVAELTARTARPRMRPPSRYPGPPDPTAPRRFRPGGGRRVWRARAGNRRRGPATRPGRPWALRPRVRSPQRRPARRGASTAGPHERRTPTGSPGRACPCDPGARPWRQAPPDHLTGEAELVQPACVVALDTGRQDVGLPLGCGCLDPLQLFEHREQSGTSFGAGGRGGVLPFAEEADKVRNRDRVNQSPPALPARPVQTHQQMTRAPAAIGKLDRRALSLEAGECRAGPGRCHRRPHRRTRRERHLRRQLVDRDRSGQLQMAADTGCDRLVVVPQCGCGLRLLCGHPGLADRRGAARADEGAEPRRPFGHRSAGDEGEQQVVELVGVARTRTHLVEDEGHRVRIQGTQLVGRHRQAVGAEPPRPRRNERAPSGVPPMARRRGT